MEPYYAQQIAEALNKIADAGLSGAQQIVLTLLGAALSTILGFLGGFRVSTALSDRAEKRQRNLLTDLLIDEVLLRWERSLRPEVMATVDKKKDCFECLQEFLSFHIGAEDLPIMKAVNDKFWDFHFLGSKELISSIVFIVVRVRDLTDTRKWAEPLRDRWVVNMYQYTAIEPSDPHQRAEWFKINDFHKKMAGMLAELDGAMMAVKGRLPPKKVAKREEEIEAEAKKKTSGP